MQKVRGGWTLLEALNAPYGMRLAEYKRNCVIRIMQREAREREIAEQRRKEAELRKKPHLFNVPQKHSRDPYWFDVTYNQMFRNGRKHKCLKPIAHVKNT